MIPSFIMNGHKVDLFQLSSFVTKTEFEKSTIAFLTEWISGSENFKIHSSGSTGKPKTISITREQMTASAKATNSFFGLKEGDTVCLCLNTNYIAGQMMIVRAMIGSLNVIAEEPSSTPDILNAYSKIHFMALIPLQARNLLKNKSLYSEQDLKAIIIGGAAVDMELEQELQQLGTPVYATFGMTETVSHIALRRLNGEGQNNLYKALPGVKLGIKDECLTIQGAITNHEQIVTNDRVDLVSPTTFKWLGRIDNVINSGGVKIQIEEVESAIRDIMHQLNLSNQFMCVKKEDSKLGEKLILVLEGNIEKSKEDLLLKTAANNLPKYWSPKGIFVLSKFPETETGKLNRQKIFNQ